MTRRGSPLRTLFWDAITIDIHCIDFLPLKQWNDKTIKFKDKITELIDNKLVWLTPQLNSWESFFLLKKNSLKYKEYCKKPRINFSEKYLINLALVNLPNSLSFSLFIIGSFRFDSFFHSFLSFLCSLPPLDRWKRLHVHKKLQKWQMQRLLGGSSLEGAAMVCFRYDDDWVFLPSVWLVVAISKCCTLFMFFFSLSSLLIAYLVKMTIFWSHRD